ncbi:MAG: adenosine kinase [Synechococcaceae cyanobacterium RL_1_2]|nr:adenosine kinase [Synechococcaceae cyanobacterium RL_1_2]
MNKKYDVYGLGNALVDMEFTLTIERLEQLGIEKGVMTLMDEERQHHVMAQLSSDEPAKTSGGSAANTIVAASQLGAKTFYSCRVADDELGNFYIQDLVKCGVAVDATTIKSDHGITGKCLVLVTPDADRTMNTFLGISAEFTEEELVPTAIADSKYLYAEGYLVTGEGAKAAAIKAMELARKSDVLTSFSLSDANMVKFFRDGLLDIIGPGVDLLFANESEALGMAQTDSFEEAIVYLKTIAKTFAVTRGPNGSVLFDGNQLIEIKSYPVEAVDTVGAGDMYAGALLYGLTHGLDFAQAGDLASRASSAIVNRFGARMTTAELQGLL